MYKYNLLLIIFYFCLFITSCSSQTEENSNQDTLDNNTILHTVEIDSSIIQQSILNQGNTNPLAYQEINIFDKTISYSKIARTGRISVFILSVPWCGPCKELRDSIAQNSHLSEFVDLYYVDMCAKHKYSELKETDSYFFYRAYDRLKEWPRVIITSQTGSIVKSFSHSDLKRECEERTLSNLILGENPIPENVNIADLKEGIKSECEHISVYEKSLEIINRLMEFQDKFHPDKNMEQLFSSVGEE